VVAEPCCGSGAIAVALARTAGCRMIATDLSPAAVALTRQNAVASAVGPLVQVVPGSLLEPVQAGLRLDAVVCNPPYVRLDEMPGLAPDIARHEPGLALVAGEDGLGVIRALVGQAASRLVAGGLLAMEIGAGQGAAVTALLSGDPWDAVRCDQDLAGRDRYVVAIRRQDTAR
jgi:release factor glutamine methyltransferase